MKATRSLHIQTYWGGAGLSAQSLISTCSAVLRNAVTRSTRNTDVVDIKSCPKFALSVLQKISFDKISKTRNAPEMGIDAKFIDEISTEGSYLLSQVIHDIDKLRKVDWTVELDPYWKDQVVNHRMMHNILYKGEGTAIMRMITTKPQPTNPNEAKIIGVALTYLENMVQCAFKTEAVYSQIFYAKFHMQRGVRDPIEREKILLGCAEAFDNFQKEVMAEHSKKALKELHWHVMGIRHWVWDCPNAKRIYSRILG